tara:strand:+ start:7937 stop:8233 length:297 start_codon:yes stop_codon:yes gene_type:complete
MKPTYSDAIIALGIEGAFSTKDGKITKWLTDETQPSEKQIQTKLKELQAEYDALEYQRDRLQEYPSIQELVVALYDEEDKEAIIERRKAVKTKYPKPE